MIYLVLLFISFIATNGTYFYLLVSQKNIRKKSISHHVAERKRTHALFVIGHFVGGLTYLIFAYKFFFIDNDNLILFIFSLLGVIFEQLQAMIPARGKTEILHTILATLMSFFIGLIILTSPLFIELSTIAMILYTLGILLLFSAGIYSIFNRSKFYYTQMIFFTMFYVMILILYFGRI
jgi:hypothetical protein